MTFGSVTADIHGTAEFPIIELSLLNKGGSTAVFTGVRVDVSGVWHLTRQMPVAQALVVSGAFELSLDPRKQSPYSETVAVSQQIDRDKADKITITVRPEPSTVFESIYCVVLHLLYNKTSVTVSTPILFALPQVSKDPPGYFYSDFLALRAEYSERKWHDPSLNILANPQAAAAAKEKDKHNRDIVYAVDSISGIRSKRVEDIIHLAKTTPAAPGN